MLIASDAPSLRAVVAGAIAGPDDQVVELRKGDEVVKEVRENLPDLVVLDMQMGNMGGVATCLELRLDESCGASEHVPVLILLDRRADVFMAERSGAEGWVVKPLDPIRLRQAAEALLAGRTYHDESFQPVSSPALDTGVANRTGHSTTKSSESTSREPAAAR